MYREKVIKALEDSLVDKKNQGYSSVRFSFEVVEIIITLLKEQPEIVRCKDCKNADFGTDEDGNRFMKCIGSAKCYGGTTPDFFCADGERK